LQTVLDPLFTASVSDARVPGAPDTPDGTRKLGLHEILHCCVTGSLSDLPRLAAHQRAPMTELLATFIAAVSLYADAPKSADEWHSLLAQSGIPLDIAPAPGCAGLLQPALPDSAKYKEATEGDIDTLGTAARHGAKPRIGFDAETAIYALIGGLHRGHGGASHYAAARGRILTIAVSDVSDAGSLASEVMSLAAALPTRAATCLADHFLWSRPWVDGEPLEALPLPVIDCRPIRLVTAADDNNITFAWTGSKGSRIAAGSDWLDDPHVPQLVVDGKPYKLLDGRAWSHRAVHASLFGSDKVRRPRILDRDGPCTLRVSSLHHTQKGLAVAAYHEAIFTADGSLWDAARCADLSQRALAAVAAAETAIWIATCELHGEGGAPRTPHANAARVRVTALAGEASVQAVLDLLPRAPDAVVEQKYIERMALDAVAAAWRETAAAALCTDVVSVARATLTLDRLARSRLNTTVQTAGNPLMSTTNDPRTHAVLHEIQNRFTPSQRASVRSTAADAIPYAAIAQLVHVPPAQVDNPECRAVWLSAIRALAQIRHGGPSIGTMLARNGYPESRLQTLLGATGTSIVGLMDECWRWLVAHDVECVTMTDLVCLGLSLADAHADTAAASDLRLKVALDYARVADRLQAA
jgi:hypothetical protein